MGREIFALFCLMGHTNCTSWLFCEARYLCSTFPKTANVSREDLREKRKAERSQGKKKEKEKEQFRKNKQGKVRQADKEKENRKVKEKQKNLTQGKEEGMNSKNMIQF